ncbi:hypothetical protein J6590_094402 [Homalodisca vitripennis]|nr:hypothetical protein J6590_094402 [Homalodisca vitripennis]
MTGSKWYLLNHVLRNSGNQDINQESRYPMNDWHDYCSDPTVETAPVFLIRGAPGAETEEGCHADRWIVKRKSSLVPEVHHLSIVVLACEVGQDVCYSALSARN